MAIRNGHSKASVLAALVMSECRYHLGVERLGPGLDVWLEIPKAVDCEVQDANMGQKSADGDSQQQL